jgi:hypothetical protein
VRLAAGFWLLDDLMHIDFSFLILSCWLQEKIEIRNDDGKKNNAAADSRVYLHNCRISWQLAARSQ